MKTAGTTGARTPIGPATVLAELGFVLAIDGCTRACRHCPAGDVTDSTRQAPWHQLERRLDSLARARRALGLSIPPRRTVHCWRLSDPLDYWSRTADDAVVTAADVARLWRAHLQPLYVVTNGSEGHYTGRHALGMFAADPTLISQLKITITPADAYWSTSRYIEELAEDLRLVLPLWELPANRPEKRPGTEARLRLNIRTTDGQRDQARAAAVTILRRAGLGPRTVRTVLADPRRVAFKRIYHLPGTAGRSIPESGAIAISDATGRRRKPTPEARAETQYGIRPDGRIFTVNMWTFTESDLTSRGRPVRWDDNEAQVVVGE